MTYIKPESIYMFIHTLRLLSKVVEVSSQPDRQSPLFTLWSRHQGNNPTRLVDTNHMKDTYHMHMVSGPVLYELR